MPEPAPPQRSTGQKVAAGVIAAAVAVAAPITAAQEGYLGRPKADPVGIKSQCFGERVDMSDLESGRIYSKDECMARLRKRLATEYAPIVLRCLPQFSDPRRKPMFAAFIDAAWNAGPANVCKSPMAANVRAGKWKAACEAFVGWHTAPKGKPLGGLVTRRRDVERPLCLQGAA